MEDPVGLWHAFGESDQAELDERERQARARVELAAVRPVPDVLGDRRPRVQPSWRTGSCARQTPTTT